MAEAKVDIDVIDSAGAAHSVLGDRACERYVDIRLLELLPSATGRASATSTSAFSSCFRRRVWAPRSGVVPADRLGEHRTEHDRSLERAPVVHGLGEAVEWRSAPPG